MVKVGIDANHQLTVFNGNYQSTKDWTNRAIVAKQLNTAYLLPNGKFINANTILQPLIRVEENQPIYVYTYKMKIVPVTQ